MVGLSPKAHRDSHHVALYLQQQGYRIVPVNPLATEILGERCWPSLTEAARHEQIDLVDVFARATRYRPLPTRPSPLAHAACGCSWAYAMMRPAGAPAPPGWPWCRTSAPWWNTNGWAPWADLRPPGKLGDNRG